MERFVVCIFTFICLFLAPLISFRLFLMMTIGSKVKRTTICILHGICCEVRMNRENVKHATIRMVSMVSKNTECLCFCFFIVRNTEWFGMIVKSVCCRVCGACTVYNALRLFAHLLCCYFQYCRNAFKWRISIFILKCPF